MDTLARTHIPLLRRPRPAFQVCGLIGLTLAILLAMSLASYLGLSYWIMAALVLVAVATFFVVVISTKIVTGRERIIYYHHEIAVMIVAAFLLWFLGQPVLPYLDLTILGIGTFLVCGRIGCLMVGCCHGRPSGWGICYREERAAAGFTPYFIGVRLFPVQAVESLWVLSIVLAGVTLVLNNHPPGAALALYVIAYDTGRFLFEFLRGDPYRPYLWAVSQPQWISLILMMLVVWAEVSGILPLHYWHIGVTGALLAVTSALAWTSRFPKATAFRLLHPQHVKEVAELVDLVSEAEAEEARPYSWTVFRKSNLTSVRISCTSLGVQISGGKVADASGNVCHYAFSYRDGGMTEESARVLARLILQLKRAGGNSKLLRGNKGVFHLFVYPVGGGQRSHQ